MSTFAANRSECIWGADAAEFKPERWLGEGKATHGGTNNRLANNITFLFGPRSCLGQSFARAEMKCLVAAFVDRFKFEMLHPDKELVVAGAVSVFPTETDCLFLTLSAHLAHDQTVGGPTSPYHGYRPKPQMSG